MEISKETKKRIKAETEYASSVYASTFHPSLPPARKIDLDFAYNKGYEEGKTSEAERSNGLVEALEQAKGCVEDVVAMDRLNLVAKQTLKKIAEALNLYNNSSK